MFTAWQSARLSHYTGGKLPSLPDCLRELKPSREQTNADRLAAMRAIMATMGAKAPKVKG